MSQNLASLSVLLDAQTAIFDRKITESTSNLERRFVSASSQSTRAVTGLASKIESESRRVQASVGAMTRGIQETQQAVTRFAAGFVGIAAISSFTSSIIASSNALTGFQQSLAAATGSQQGAAGALAFVRAESDRLGLSVEKSAAQFAQLTAATRGTSLEGDLTRKIFSSMAQAARVLNLSVEKTDGAFRAFEQMISKGKVQAEELRGQLGERLPGAFRLAAEAMGVTTAQLDDMLKKGKVAAEDLLPKLADRLDELYGAAATNAANSPAAEFQRLSNSIFELENAIGNAGFMESLASGARTLAESLTTLTKSGAIDDLVTGVGALATVAGVAFAGRAVQGINDYTAGLVKAAAAQSGLLEVERLAAAASLESARANSVELASTLEVVNAARQELVAKQALAAVEVEVAKRTLDATKNIGFQSAALREQRVATEQLAAAQLKLRGITNELASLGAAQTATQARLASSAAEQVAAQQRLAGALTGTQVALQGLQKFGSAAFAMIGGWPTVIIAAAAALYYFVDAMEQIEERSRAPIKALEELNAGLEKQIALRRIASEGIPTGEAESVSLYRQNAEAVEKWTANLVEVEAQIAAVTRTGGPGFTYLSQAAENLRSKIADSQDQMEKFGILTGQVSTDIVAKFRLVAGEGGNALADLAEKAVSTAELIGRVFSVGDSSGLQESQTKFSKEVQRTIDALRKQSDTFGLAQSQATLYEAGIEAANAATAEEAAAIQAVALELSKKQAAQEAATAAKKDHTAAVREGKKEDAAEAKALRQLDQEWNAYFRVIQQVKREHAEVAQSYAAQQKEFDQQAADIQREIDLLTKVSAERERAAIAMEAERLSRDKNGESVEKERRRLEGLLTTYSKLAKADSILDQLDDGPISSLIDRMDDLREAMVSALDIGPPTDEMVEHIERIQGAVGAFNSQLLSESVGAFKSLLQAAQTFTEEGSSGFESMEKGIAALSILQDILALKAAVTAVMTQGEGEPYSAWARMAAMAAAVAPMLASIGVTLSSFGGGGGPTMSETRQEQQGTGTILGDASAKSESMLNALDIIAEATSQLPGLSRGMLTALQGMQRGISGASASLARTGFSDISLAEGMGMNSVLNPFGASTIGGRIVSSIFGGDQDLIDQGLLIRGGAFSSIAANPNASSYQTIETDGGWFGSDDLDDELGALSDAANTQIRLILTSIGDAVREGAEALGLDMVEINRAIEQFRLEEIRISTMDLTGEEAQAELEAVFSSIFDGLADAVVPFIDQFQQVGEGMGETLVRVATSVQVANEAWTQLGLAMDEVDPETVAQISVGLIEAVGSIEDFIQGMQSFVSSFAPEAHRFEIAQDALTRALTAVGLALPDTRDGLWTLMQSLDATTESGREQIATLLRLAGTADAYYDQLDRNAETAAHAIEVQREAMQSYAEFIDQFGAAFRQGSPFQQAMQDVRRELAANIETANELARAAGLSAAREEDLLAIRQHAERETQALIAGLTETIVQQIADLYGTTAEEFERQIAAIDAEIAAMDRSDSSFGMVQNLMREAQLGAERQQLAEELAAQMAAQEALMRQTQALSLAQNLADLSIARGVGFEQIASELGLDLTRFGTDLGVQADAVDDLIRTLQVESLTGDDYFDGVQAIVDAINGIGEKPDFAYFMPDETDPSGRGGKSRFNEVGVEPARAVTDELLLEEIRAFRRELTLLQSEGNSHTEAVVREQVETNRTLRNVPLELDRNKPPGTRQSRPKGR
jgi:tape measure domain-containing protein